MLELPYLKSLGIDGRAQGPKEIEGFIASLLAKVPDFAFKNVRFLMETPEQVFAEYEVEALVPSTGKIYRQMYAGRLVARDGKISLLREALDTMAAAHAFSMGQLIEDMTMKGRFINRSGLTTFRPDWPQLAASRQCHLRSARRRPAIERGRTRPWISELDADDGLGSTPVLGFARNWPFVEHGTRSEAENRSGRTPLAPLLVAQLCVNLNLEGRNGHDAGTRT